MRPSLTPVNIHFNLCKKYDAEINIAIDLLCSQTRPFGITTVFNLSARRFIRLIGRGLSRKQVRSSRVGFLIFKDWLSRTAAVEKAQRKSETINYKTVS